MPRRDQLARHPLLWLVLVSFLVGCDGTGGSSAKTIGPSLTVTRTDWGLGWPFTIDRGELRCVGRGADAQLYFMTPELRIYAMNAPAVAAGIKPTIQTAPFYTGKPLTPLIDRGQELCR